MPTSRKIQTLRRCAQQSSVSADQIATSAIKFFLCKMDMHRQIKKDGYLRHISPVRAFSRIFHETVSIWFFSCCNLFKDNTGGKTIWAQGRTNQVCKIDPAVLASKSLSLQFQRSLERKMEPTPFYLSHAFLVPVFFLSCSCHYCKRRLGGWLHRMLDTLVQESTFQKNHRSLGRWAASTVVTRTRRLLYLHSYIYQQNTISLSVLVETSRFCTFRLASIDTRTAFHLWGF